MTRIVFLRHFETEVDEDIPVSEWELTADGEAALQRLLERDAVGDVDRVYSSPEQNAHHAAAAIAEANGVPLETVDALHEVDRSGEGFVPDHDDYVDMAERYLRYPTVPFDWEDREAVAARAATFLDAVDTADDRVVAVTHGLFLATVVAPMEGVDRVAFWSDLEFGETVGAEYGELVDSLRR